jgi:hypothetical protein
MVTEILDLLLSALDAVVEAAVAGAGLVYAPAWQVPPLSTILLTREGSLDGRPGETRDASPAFGECGYAA